LTGKFNRETRFQKNDHRSFNLSPDRLEKYLLDLLKLHPLFDSYPNQAMTPVSLRFCISHPACHTAIAGAKTSLQAADNCAASDPGSILLDEVPARSDY